METNWHKKLVQNQINQKAYFFFYLELKTSMSNLSVATPILADPAARQPLSESSALPTVSTMTGALGGTESRLANQQGPDPLTNYLQKMSKSQLLEIITEIKVRTKKQKNHFRLCIPVNSVYFLTARYVELGSDSGFFFPFFFAK